MIMEYYAAFAERIDGFSSRACLVSLKRAEKNPNAGKTIITVGMPTLMAECSKCSPQLQFGHDEKIEDQNDRL